MVLLAGGFAAGSAGADARAIPAPFYYALFRAGLPAKEDTLYRTDTAGVTAGWS